MKNEDMKANRFGRWSAARSKVAQIIECLAADGQVQVTNYMHSTLYTKKHINYFEARKSGAYVRHGNKMLCFDGCAVRFGRKTKAA